MDTVLLGRSRILGSLPGLSTAGSLGVWSCLLDNWHPASVWFGMSNCNDYSSTWTSASCLDTVRITGHIPAPTCVARSSSVKKAAEMIREVLQERWCFHWGERLFFILTVRVAVVFFVSRQSYMFVAEYVTMVNILLVVTRTCWGLHQRQWFPHLL